MQAFPVTSHQSQARPSLGTAQLAPLFCIVLGRVRGIGGGPVGEQQGPPPINQLPPSDPSHSRRGALLFWRE